MDKEQIMEMFALRLEGQSLEEIAQRFGVSKEWVRQCLDGRCKGRRGKAFKCAYGGIGRWMVDNGLSVPKLFAKTSAFKNTGVLRRCLAGEQRLSLEQIRDLLNITGLSFEEAFEKQEEAVF